MGLRQKVSVGSLFSLWYTVCLAAGFGGAMIDFYTRLLEFKDVEGARKEIRTLGKRTAEERRTCENRRYDTEPGYRERKKQASLATYYRRKQKSAKS
jgi:hypothetical protein